MCILIICIAGFRVNSFTRRRNLFMMLIDFIDLSPIDSFHQRFECSSKK